MASRRVNSLINASIRCHKQTHAFSSTSKITSTSTKKATSSSKRSFPGVPFRSPDEEPSKKFTTKELSYWDLMVLKARDKELPPAVPLHQYRRYEARDLAELSSPPKCARMLVRDFIHDSLYNPTYGYFTKNAVIFNPEKSGIASGDSSAKNKLDWNNIKDEYEFHSILTGMYKAYEKEAESGAVDRMQGVSRQIWHTPAELFKPWYGFAIAKYILTNHKSSPNTPLVIYETGAGNGTLMKNILDYVQQHSPETYATMKYKIIEISPKLASEQRRRACEGNGHQSKVEIINQSIFDWKNKVDEECYFLATEVVDNFPHDMIRYSTTTHTPYQTIVLVSENGDISEAYEPLSDPLLVRYQHYKSEIESEKTSNSITNLFSKQNIDKLKTRIRLAFPFAPNLSRAEWCPTRLLNFVEILHENFPKHKLILTDFSALPDTIDSKAYLAPVVQTRYENQTVPVSTYRVSQGWFDIFFPTDFDLLKDLYKHVGRRKLEQSAGSVHVSSEWVEKRNEGKVFTHDEFLREWADLEKTRFKSGENPILSFYKNVKFFVSS